MGRTVVYSTRRSLSVQGESAGPAESVGGAITVLSALTDGDTEAALELVLAVVEEGAEDQRERQGEQLLF